MSLELLVLAACSLLCLTFTLDSRMSFSFALFAFAPFASSFPISIYLTFTFLLNTLLPSGLAASVAFPFCFLLSIGLRGKAAHRGQQGG